MRGMADCSDAERISCVAMEEPRAPWHILAHLGTSWHILAHLGTSWKQDREEDDQDTLFFVDTGGVPCQDSRLWVGSPQTLHIFVYFCMTSLSRDCRFSLVSVPTRLDVDLTNSEQSWNLIASDCLGGLNCSSQAELAWALLYVLLFTALHSQMEQGFHFCIKVCRSKIGKRTSLFGMQSHHSDLHILRSDAAYVRIFSLKQSEEYVFLSYWLQLQM